MSERQISEAAEPPVTNPLGLTDREVLIVWAWATGRNNDWIEDFTGRTHSMIRTQGKHLLKKLCARNRAHATAIVLREILDMAPVAGAKRPERIVSPIDRIIEGAREAIRQGADPVLILSYVLWPPESLTDRLAA